MKKDKSDLRRLWLLPLVLMLGIYAPRTAKVWCDRPAAMPLAPADGGSDE